MNIDRQLSLLISEHMSEYVIAFAKIMDNDVSASQYYILQTIAKDGPKKSSELAVLLGVSLPAVTNLTNKLERKGYVDRHYVASDRRTVLLQITEEGQSIVNKMIAKSERLSEVLRMTFTDEEKERLIEAYQKMIEALKRETGTLSEQ